MEDVIGVQSLVCLVSDATRKGVVMAVSGEGDMAQYTVFMDGQIRTFYAEQVRPCQIAPTNWVDRDTFRSYLTSSLINTPSAGSLYSLNSARIDFVPYQFRPALKILKADEPRILIADSVGVGKTIEAGLIIKELEAHADVRSIAIVCPKPLVAERKWEGEMREKFDEDFVQMDGPMLRQALSDTDRDGVWPTRYSKVIIPYSIFDQLAFEGNGEAVKARKARGRVYGFEDVAELLDFDVVIVDEAHHIRNGSMQAEKAFAYKCVKTLCDHARAVVMLTATPLQTSSHDLYTLLNVLRPDVVLDYEVYTRMAEPNPFISECASIIRAATDNWQRQALESLSRVRRTTWGLEVIVPHPTFARVEATLSRQSLSREDRVRLITDVESLNSFSSLINRTRRRDIEDFCIRDPKTLKSYFTAPQKILYDAVLAFERKALTALHGTRSVEFMVTTIKRQAASCIFGLAPFLDDILNRRLAELGHEAGDIESGGIGTAEVELLSQSAGEILRLAEELPKEDAKFDQVMSVIQEKMMMPKNKIMLFSSFKHTLAYVRNKFHSAGGIRFAQIDGEVKDEDRRTLTARFRLPKEDPDAIDVMLFTEVGSEGLDYQFCDMMINYDLPWNPMAVEQRIGRIDRRKQQSKKVSIVNLITEGTVDADIYNRCLWRIGVFQQSLGECEAILGSVAEDIRTIILDGKLTEEQRRQLLEQTADNKIRQVQEQMRLEEQEKAFFGIDLSGSREVEEAKNPWLSEACIQGLVEHYFNLRLGPGSYILGSAGRKTLRLSAGAKEKLLEDARRFLTTRSSLREAWDLYLRGSDPTAPVTFDREVAQTESSVLFLTTVHPLVVQAAAYCSHEERVSVSTPCIAFRYRTDAVPPGRYPFAVYTWNYKGFIPQFRMVTVPVDEKLEKLLPSIVEGAGEYLLSADGAASMWDGLDPAHGRIWRRAKDEHVAETQAMARYRAEAARTSFARKKTILEKKIASSVHPNMTRMAQSELETAREKMESRLAKIQETAEQADILFTQIANGLVIVEE